MTSLGQLMLELDEDILTETEKAGFQPVVTEEEPKEDMSPKKGKKKPKKEEPVEEEKPKEEPEEEKSGITFEGINSLTRNPHVFSLENVVSVSRYMYVHDIHVENAQVIDATWWAILRNDYHVTVMIDEETFNELYKAHKRRGIFTWSSINEKPRMRQYTKVNNEKWPTEKEIEEMDKQISQFWMDANWQHRKLDPTGLKQGKVSHVVPLTTEETTEEFSDDHDTGGEDL